MQKTFLVGTISADAYLGCEQDVSLNSLATAPAIAPDRSSMPVKLLPIGHPTWRGDSRTAVQLR